MTTASIRGGHRRNPASLLSAPGLLAACRGRGAGGEARPGGALPPDAGRVHIHHLLDLP